MSRILWTSLIVLLAVCSLSSSPDEEAARYLVKTPDRVSCQFDIRKSPGPFYTWEANLKMPADSFTDATLELGIDAASVETGSGFKDKEVKGKNFFAAKEYPEIRFVSKTITSDGDPSKFRMNGELTLRGITQPVCVSVVLRRQENGNQWIDGESSLNRQDFGMTHNMPFNRIANAVGVKFRLDVQNGVAPATESGHQSHLKVRPSVDNGSF
jgi:polyisoprenoid-binding protein YceI